MLFLLFRILNPKSKNNIDQVKVNEVVLLIDMNGSVVFLLKMLLIKWLKDVRYSKVNLMLFGFILLDISILTLNFIS